jgi:uncharacterized protein YndB with AHSA1/START domain
MNVTTPLTVKPSLTLKRRIKAPPSKVFAAWTDPVLMARWLGPVGTVKLIAMTDLRAGGSYEMKMLMPDDEHNVSGVYREIIPNEKLVFTWAWRSSPERESLVTVLLKPDGDGTLLTLTHEQFFDEPARDRHRQGWSGTLDKLDQLFA